jgi:hypothetical protein
MDAMCHIGGIRVELTKDNDGPDTQVEVCINEARQNWCWINWEDKNKFIEELSNIISKYRI